ncbi:MAG: DNA internalization-related competence protein ComEC/Rec2 [Clostridia bacterium]|nr:DNA internalization-related competence protein ComEC/Rec2 [Clostridia bacterium]
MSVCAGFLCWYLVGIAVSNIADLGSMLLFSLTLLVVSILGVFCKHLKGKRLLFAIGALMGTLAFSFSAEPMPSQFDAYVGRYIEVEGIISQVPDKYDEYYSYILTSEKIRYNNEEIDIEGKLKVTCETSFSTGNRIAIRGFLKEIEPPDNSTEFDYKTYYKSKGISYTIHTDEVQLVNERAFLFSPVYCVEYVKNRISVAVDRFYADDDAGIIKAVLLGKRSQFTDDFKKLLVSTSAMRFLYPSFLHIFFLLSVCEFIFMAVSKRKRELLMVLAILMYSAFAGNYITFVRAALIMAMVIIYRRIRGFSHYPDIVAIVATACLVSNPLLLYNSGFVMSVSIGMLLHWFRRPLAAKLRFIRNINVRNMVAVWIVGTIGLMPLSAYYYNGASMYSVIFTFFYTPLSMMLFILFPINLLLLEIFGNSGLFGILIEIIIELMQNMPQMVALLPGHYLAIGRTTVVGFLVSFLIVYIIKCAVDREIRNVKFKMSVAALVGIFCVYTISVFADLGKMRITFVNVGQGDAAIVDIIGKDTILVDGGGGAADSDYNIGEEVFLPYLTAKGYSKIDLAIVSHCHKDHVEGIIAAIENLEVHTVMLSGCNEGTEYRERVVSVAEANGTEVLYVNAGDKLEFGSGLIIDVLSPGVGEKYDDENDYSLALKMTYDGTSAFFGGDITAEAEERLFGKVGDVDIVKVSHHGSKNSSSQEFVSEVKPEYAVFCVGKNNMHSHPADRVVEEYFKVGARVLRTDIMKDITLLCNKNKIAAAWYGEVMKWQ